jgi:hypothetical protein
MEVDTPAHAGYHRQAARIARRSSQELPLLLYPSALVCGPARSNGTESPVKRCRVNSVVFVARWLALRLLPVHMLGRVGHTQRTVFPSLNGFRQHKMIASPKGRHFSAYLRSNLRVKYHRQDPPGVGEPVPHLVGARTEWVRPMPGHPQPTGDPHRLKSFTPIVNSYPLALS